MGPFCKGILAAESRKTRVSSGNMGMPAMMDRFESQRVRLVLLEQRNAGDFPDRTNGRSFPLKREPGGTSSGPGSPRRPMADWPAATDGGLAMKRAALAKKSERPDCPPVRFCGFSPKGHPEISDSRTFRDFRRMPAKVSPPRQSSSGKTRSRLRIVINSFRLKSLWRTSRIAWTRIDFSMILRIYLPLEKRPFCSRDLTRTR